MSRRAREGRAQATVELALVLPVIVLFVLLVVQLGLVVRDQLMVLHAAREGARAAAVQPDAATATAAVLATTALDPTRVEVAVGRAGSDGGLVTVTVTYASHPGVPIVGALVGDVGLRESVTMRVESP